MRKLLLIISTIFMALAVTACGDSEVLDDEIIDDDTDPITASLAVSDQVINEDAEINIASVQLPEGQEGWVAIWTVDAMGNPDTVLGAIEVNDGQTNDIKLDLPDNTFTMTTDLIAAVHIDMSDDEEFDPSVDVLAQDVDGNPILETFEVTLGDPG